MMEEFCRFVAHVVVGVIRQLIYLYFFGFIIIYTLLVVFGFNFWTFVLGHVIVFILMWLKPMK
jgi:hypothetical protein